MTRVEIYENALEILQGIPLAERWCVGLCHVLTDVMLLEKYGMNYSQMLNQPDDSGDKAFHIYVKVNNSVFGRNDIFPEIVSHKAPNWVTGYWPISYQDRIDILKECIEQAKAAEAAKKDFDMNHYDGSDILYE